MRIKILLMAAAASVAMTGCSYPLKEPRPISLQQSLESASHWNEVADTTAEKVASGLSRIADMEPGHQLGDVQITLASRPVYVRPVDSGTPFSQAFRDLLIQKFLEKGHAVATQPAGAVVVNYDVQVVSHARNVGRDGYVPGDVTIGTTAAYFAWEAIDWSENSLQAGLLATGPILDLVSMARHYLTDVPNAEVVVSTAVLDEHAYLLRTADVFYVNDVDAQLFKPSLGVKQTRLLATGSQTPAPTRATTVQFVRE